MDYVWQVHAHKAAKNLVYHHPFMPYEGTHCVGERGSDTDVLAVFVADVTPTWADAYVLSDTERSYSDGTIQTNWPTEVFLGRDGGPVVRLSAVFMHSLLHNGGRDIDYLWCCPRCTGWRRLIGKPVAGPCDSPARRG